jgi:hypothetical protein
MYICHYFEISMNTDKDIKKVGIQNEYPKLYEKLVNIIIFL